MTYSIELVYDDGRIEYLSVRGRTAWKTKRRAIHNAQGITDRVFSGLILVIVVGQYGNTVKEIWRVPC